MTHYFVNPWKSHEEHEQHEQEDSSPMLTYTHDDDDPPIKAEPDMIIMTASYDNDSSSLSSIVDRDDYSEDSMSINSHNDNENLQSPVVKIEAADALVEIVQTVRRTQANKRKKPRRVKPTSHSLSYFNVLKRVPGKRNDLITAWVNTFPRLYEILDDVPLNIGRDLDPSIFERLPCKSKNYYLPRGTRRDTIDVQSATVYTDGTTACTVVRTTSGEIYVPLNDVRTAQMPIRISRCYHLLATLAIGHTTLKIREKICEPNIPITYQYANSRTPLLSLSLLVYLASPCIQGCTSTRGHCKIPWCWTLRCTINPTMFANVIELLKKRGILCTNKSQ